MDVRFRYGGLAGQINLKHGPRDLLARYFAGVDDALRERGLRVSICTDFDRLVRLNRENRDSWPPLMPFSDPAFSKLDEGGAFWLDVRDRYGDTVMTHGGRLLDWSDTTLEQEAKTLRLLYAEPAPHLAAGDTIDIIDAPSASCIRGRLLLTSSAWVHPDFRSHGLCKIVPRVSRVYAYTRWSTRCTIYFIDPKLHALGVTRAYGDYRSEGLFAFRLLDRGEVLGVLCRMTARTMLREVADIVRLRENRPVAQQRSTKDEFVSALALPG